MKESEPIHVSEIVDGIFDYMRFQKTIGYIYLMKFGDVYKIGRSSQLSLRCSQLIENYSNIDPKLPHCMEFIFSYKVLDMFVIEKWFHRLFASKRLQGEWFRLEAKDIIVIKKILEHFSNPETCKDYDNFLKLGEILNGPQKND